MTCDQFRSTAIEVFRLNYEERTKFLGHFEECNSCQEEVMKADSTSKLKPDDLECAVELAVEDSLRYLGKLFDTELANELRAHFRQEMAKND